jgi:hypothetical protein
MDREGRIFRLLLQTSLLSFIKLVGPDRNHLLQLGSDKITE